MYMLSPHDKRQNDISYLTYDDLIEFCQELLLENDDLRNQLDGENISFFEQPSETLKQLIKGYETNTI